MMKTAYSLFTLVDATVKLQAEVSSRVGCDCVLPSILTDIIRETSIGECCDWSKGISLELCKE